MGNPYRHPISTPVPELQGIASIASRPSEPATADVGRAIDSALAEYVRACNRRSHDPAFSEVSAVVVPAVMAALSRAAPSSDTNEGEADVQNTALPVGGVQQPRAMSAVQATSEQVSVHVTKSRFGHHPDPAIDFEIEVAEIESITESARIGLTGPKHDADRAGLARRIEMAMLFQVGGDPSACAAMARLRNIADAAPSSGHAMAEGEREKVARLLCRQHGGEPDAVASEPHDCWDGPLWTAFTTEADEIIAALATTPPTTNDAIPAGEWGYEIHVHGGYRPAWLRDVDYVDIRGNVSPRWYSERCGGLGVRATSLVWAGTPITLRLQASHPYYATPKPSPTPKGGLPGRGEVPTDAQVREAMQDAWDNFCDDAQAIPGDIRREGRKTYFVAGVWADHTAMALRAILSRAALAPAEAIRDGGEGGEG